MKPLLPTPVRRHQRGLASIGLFAGILTSFVAVPLVLLMPDSAGEALGRTGAAIGSGCGVIWDSGCQVVDLVLNPDRLQRALGGGAPIDLP